MRYRVQRRMGVTRRASDAMRFSRPARQDLRRDVMRMIANCLVTSGLVLVTAFAVAQAQAAELDATSAVDAVTVYPDGASVTRVIMVDLPAGDHTLVAPDFPLALDPSSLRVEGEAEAKFTLAAT